MSPSDLFQKERADYLQALKLCLAQIRESDPQAASELLVELNTLEVPRPYRLMRPDIVYRNGDETKICKVVKDEWISFEPVDLQLTSGGLLKLNPFQWGSMELKLGGEVSDWLPFEEWVARWLDAEDARSSPDADFAGVIHQASQPVLLDGFWCLLIDMGSANLEALNELFDALGALRVRHVELLTSLNEAS